MLPEADYETREQTRNSYIARRCKSCRKRANSLSRYVQIAVHPQITNHQRQRYQSQHAENLKAGHRPAGVGWWYELEVMGRRHGAETMPDPRGDFSDQQSLSFAEFGFDFEPAVVCRRRLTLSCVTDPQDEKASDGGREGHFEHRKVRHQAVTPDQD